MATAPDDRSVLVRLKTRARAGDHQAAWEVVERLSSLVRWWLREDLWDRPDADEALDDLHQSALTKIRAGLPGCRADTDEGVMRWAATVTRNHRREWQRSQLKTVLRWCPLDRAGVGSRSAPLGTVEEEDGEQRLKEKARLIASVDEVLAGLSEEDRHVIEGRREGRSWRRLADEAGLSRSGMRHRFDRAVRRLQRILDEMGGAD